MKLDRPNHNPKAPHSRRAMLEVEADLDAFVDRLARLGAEADVITAVRDHWNDPDWDEAERTMLVGMSDDALAGELASIEREYDEGTTTEEEAAERDALATEVTQILPEPAPVVIEWMRRENIVARAVAVEAAEAQQRRPRTTVLAAAAEIIDAAEQLRGE